MSATAGVNGSDGQKGHHPVESGRYRAYAISVVLAASIALSLSFLLTAAPLSPSVGDIVVWSGLVVLSSLMPVPSGRGAWLSLDLPLLLGLGFVFGPLVAGVVALVACCDPREARRSVSVYRAAFNRAQVCLCVVVASSVFMIVRGTEGQLGRMAAAYGLAIAVDLIINYGLVAASTSLTLRQPFARTLQDMYVGSRKSFVLAYVCFAFLALIAAEAYLRIGMWGVLACATPLVLAREYFRRSHELEVAEALLETQSEALSRLDEAIADERGDERHLLAGELHDEVLPPLYKVHLMGQVVHQDISSGRLLDLDRDVPELVSATKEVQGAVRNLIRGLRISPVGPAGLVSTLWLLVQQLESAGSPKIRFTCGADISGSRVSQLVVYQVAREALGNASKYSRAREIEVELSETDDSLALTVRDNGIGFDPSRVDSASHFGLQMLSERVHALGGCVRIDSQLGSGTVISVRVPKQP